MQEYASPCAGSPCASPPPPPTDPRAPRPSSHRPWQAWPPYEATMISFSHLSCREKSTSEGALYLTTADGLRHPSHPPPTSHTRTRQCFRTSKLFSNTIGRWSSRCGKRVCWQAPCRYSNPASPEALAWHTVMAPPALHPLSSAPLAPSALMTDAALSRLPFVRLRPTATDRNLEAVA